MFRVKLAVSANSKQIWVSSSRRKPEEWLAFLIAAKCLCPKGKVHSSIFPLSSNQHGAVESDSVHMPLGISTYFTYSP